MRRELSRKIHCESPIGVAKIQEYEEKQHFVSLFCFIARRSARLEIGIRVRSFFMWWLQLHNFIQQQRKDRSVKLNNLRDLISFVSGLREDNLHLDSISLTYEYTPEDPLNITT